jgi:hypothetical protein
MAAFARMSRDIKNGEYDDEPGPRQTGQLRFFNAIDGYMGTHALTSRQRDALWKEYFNRQTARIMRRRGK